MLISTEDCLGDLRCPITKAKLTVEHKCLIADDAVTQERREYPIVNGKPILVNFERSVLEEDNVKQTAAESQIARAT